MKESLKFNNRDYIEEHFKQEDKIIDFLTGQFYKSKNDVFLRELLQNAIDSITLYQGLMQNISSTDIAYKDYFTKFNKIKVIFEKVPQGLEFLPPDDYPDFQITIIDSGIGLDTLPTAPIKIDVLKDVIDLKDFDHLSQNMRSNIIGFFGIGRLSVFKVSDCVRYITRPAPLNRDQLDRQIYHEIIYIREWQGSVPRSTYKIYSRSDTQLDKQLDSDMEQQGTKVTVYLKRWQNKNIKNLEARYIQENAKQIADIQQIKASIEKYLISVNNFTIKLVDNLKFQNKEIYLKLGEDNFLPKPFREISSSDKIFYDNCTVEDYPDIKFSVLCVVSPQYRIIIYSKGLLINDDYPLGITSNSITSYTVLVHLISEQTLPLQHSRELFVENDAFQAFRITVQSYLNRFEKILLKSTITNTIIISPDSDKARLLETRYYQQKYDEEIFNQIKENIQFPCYYLGQTYYLKLAEIPEFIKIHSIKKIYYEFSRIGRVRASDATKLSYEKVYFGDSNLFIDYFATKPDILLIKVHLKPDGLQYPPYYDILNRFLNKNCNGTSFSIINDKRFQKIVDMLDVVISYKGFETASDDNIFLMKIPPYPNGAVQPVYISTSLQEISLILNIESPELKQVIENVQNSKELVKAIQHFLLYNNKSALKHLLSVFT